MDWIYLMFLLCFYNTVHSFTSREKKILEEAAKYKGEGQPHGYGSLFTKDPLRGYNMYLGTPEPVGFRVDPGFASLIFDRGLTYEGYHIFPSTICDVKSKTTEITTVDEFKKFSSERTSFNGNFAYSGVQVGGSSSNARSESIAGQKMSEKNLYITSAECWSMTYKMAAFGAPRLTENFLHAVTRLTEEHGRYSRFKIMSRNQKKSPRLIAHDTMMELRHQKYWFEFFNEFGTHFFEEMITGSRYRTETFISKRLIKGAEKEEIASASTVSASIDFAEMAMSVATAGVGTSALSGILKSVKGFKGLTSGLKGLKAFKGITKEGLKGFNQISSMIQKLGGPIAANSEQISKLAVPLKGISNALTTVPSSSGGPQGGEDGGSKCGITQLCFSGSSEEVTRKERVWENVERNMEATTFSVGARPVKITDEDHSSASLLWASTADFSPLPLRYSPVSIDRIFDRDQRPLVEGLFVSNDMRDTCREMLHRYCLQSIREDQNVVELCGEYKKSFHESIENRRLSRDRSIKVHFLSNFELIDTLKINKSFSSKHPSWSLYRLRTSMASRGIFVLSDFAVEKGKKMHLFGISSEKPKQLAQPIGFFFAFKGTTVDFRRKYFPMQQPGSHFDEEFSMPGNTMTDTLVYLLIKCPSGYGRVGGVIIRKLSDFRRQRPDLSIYTCVSSKLLATIGKYGRTELKWSFDILRSSMTFIQKTTVVSETETRGRYNPMRVVDAMDPFGWFSKEVLYRTERRVEREPDYFTIDRFEYPKMVRRGKKQKSILDLFSFLMYYNHWNAGLSITKNRIRARFIQPDAFNAERNRLKDMPKRSSKTLKFTCSTSHCPRHADGKCSTECASCIKLSSEKPQNMRLVFESVDSVDQVTITSCCGKHFNVEAYLGTGSFREDKSLKLMPTVQENEGVAVLEAFHQRGNMITVWSNSPICTVGVRGFPLKK